MKNLRKIFTWIAKAIAWLMAIIVLAGVSFRLLAPAPQVPGKLVDIGGFKLHINSEGEKSHKPTLIIETGQALPSEHYHWLSEGLKGSMRVVRYDRAGIAYSDHANTPRDPKTIARELHTLLEKSGESPPYILAGHSFGGLFIRVYAQLYPDEVAGMVFLDSSHPDQRQRLNRTDEKDYSWIINSFALLADAGILGMIERLSGSMFYVEEFPDEVNHRFHDYMLNGKYLRGYRDEMKWSKSVYDQSRETKDFASMPIRVFTAGKKYDGTEANPTWLELQAELATLSTNGQHFILDGHHNSIYTSQKNAEIICGEIQKLVKDLGY